MDSKHAVNLLKQLIIKYGQVRHNDALESICKELAERRKTVRAKRPAQQIKAEIASCVDRYLVAINQPDCKVELSDFIKELRQLSAV